MEPATAKQQMGFAVDDVTGRLGGDWHRRTGPDSAESCRQTDGSGGAKWRYLVSRAARGEPAQDASAFADHWTSQGMKVQRWGTDDSPTVVGRGGDQLASISLTALASTGYSVEAVSLCFPGDADELNSDE